ncbi:E3 ubiquitin-protein ligase RGLG1 [Zea mays]|uniref:E3 ubiquitin-protein ligase RGLG1 n=1 Tax=Zea mays TaxID=4577 RepID=A0A1D6PQ30_MAIZE|nr:E3 ubiquitin-protein ligase RGLG1 [Zea mays]
MLRLDYLSERPNLPLLQVTDALAQAGLESSNLIVGIDFTKSNEWTGKFSFHGRSLYHISNTPNPYEQAISIIGRTLSKFDEDNLIPCFGFGDASTHDQDVFYFSPDEKPCNGFEEALDRYRELVPHLRLAGPTSFAPIIEMAMTIVEQSGGQYHVLLIIADGQVTRSVDTASGQLSSQEQKTVDAIVKASELPLSIVLVGVGDGPWDMMKEFDDNIPARAFDNFQLFSSSGSSDGGAGPALRRSSSVSSKVENPVQGLIAYCKRSQQLAFVRKSASDAGFRFLSSSASRIAAESESDDLDELTEICRG